MNIINDISKFIGNYINIDSTYIYLMIKTIILIIIMNLIKKLGLKIIGLKKDNKKKYILSKSFKIILVIITIFLLLFIWDTYIKSLMTLISLVSAAVTIALRELIFNFFCGLYISIKKPFSLEDRIEFDDIKGDVINISNLYFELLEVDDSKVNGQSTGKIITVPNSFIFTKSIKNYNKAFKYIWYELNVKVPLNCNLKSTKQELYKIINNIDTVKKVPLKMKNQINNAGNNYRIYFNKLDPMIYTKVCDSYIELQIRYLIHPKKARFVESVIWNKILVLRDNGLIKLYES